LLLEPMPLIFLTLAVSAAIWGIFFNKARIDFV